MDELELAILKAKRPKDLFKNVKSEKEMKSEYNKLCKMYHPDNNNKTEDIFKKLVELYQEGLKELEKGIYNEIDLTKIYRAKNELILSFETNKGLYEFYEQYQAEVSNIFKGVINNELVTLKLIDIKDDNELIEKEYEILNKLNHLGLCKLIEKVTINECTGIILKNEEGDTLETILNEYRLGIDQEHVLWMLERILSVLGYLHSNYIVHGNIQPDNIIVNKKNHNVVLTGLCFSITEANLDSAKYMIKNNYSSKSVNSNKKVEPKTDVYSLAKLCIKILGGNIERDAMPLKVDIKVRNLIREMLNETRNENQDCWRLWDKVIKLRTELYGDRRFSELK